MRDLQFFDVVPVASLLEALEVEEGPVRKRLQHLLLPSYCPESEEAPTRLAALLLSAPEAGRVFCRFLSRSWADQGCVFLPVLLHGMGFCIDMTLCICLGHDMWRARVCSVRGHTHVARRARTHTRVRAPTHDGRKKVQLSPHPPQKGNKYTNTCADNKRTYILNNEYLKAKYNETVTQKKHKVKE